MISPLDAIARWRAAENAIESALTLFITAGAWAYAWRLFSRPHVGRPATFVEEVIILGGCVALTSWVVSLHLHMIGWRRPRRIVSWSSFSAVAVLFTVRLGALWSFRSACEGTWMGVVASANDLLNGPGTETACIIGEVPGNPYLPGTVLTPFWDGEMSGWMWLLMAIFGVLSALGLRDRRLRSTRIGVRLLERLSLAPGAGPGSALGELKPDDDVVACANPTLWGEPCGQLFAAERAFQPGEWCGRCKQPFTPADRKLRFSVVTLVSTDIDILNGLERMDTLSWPVGSPLPPDARISGQERWTKLGEIELPDVLSVAQALAMVHARLDLWKGAGDPTQVRGAQLAMERASRVCAWIWFGRVNHRMTYARPTNQVRFGLGSARLRDLVPDSGETLTLQLDTGLLPLELRLAFRRSFLDETRADELRNSKLDLWIPVAPPPSQKGEKGVWVDRIEGDALRAWLSTDRVRPEDARGVSTPLGYMPGKLTAPPPARPLGRLDFVRRPVDPEADEPTPERLPGASIAEWDWFDGAQIELMRQEALVLVDTGVSARPEEVS